MQMMPTTHNLLYYYVYIIQNSPSEQWTDRKMVYALCVKKYLTYAIDAFHQVYHRMKLFEVQAKENIVEILRSINFGLNSIFYINKFPLASLEPFIFLIIGISLDTKLS